MSVDIPIIILVWENWSDTKMLLDSLQSAEVTAPIWLFDNGSQSVQPLREIREAFPWIRYFRLDMNYGFAGGMNRALKEVSDEGFNMAYAINNDCLVTNDFLSPVVKMAKVRHDMAIMGSRYLSKGKSGQYDIWGFHSNPLEGELYRDGFMQTDKVVGCGMLIKIHPFFDVGGFDERFFCYGEEDDLCYRLQKKGYTVGMCFDSLILHNHQGSDIGGNSIYYRTRNEYLLKSLHPDMKMCMRHPLDVINSACQNIHNYENFSSYIEGLHCGRSNVFGKRNVLYHGSTVYLLFAYYYLLYLPHRVLIFFERILTKIKSIWSCFR